MNHLTITGALGRDAELRYLPDGSAVLGFSVADSQGKDKPAIWWRCSMFGKRADAMSQYLTKGQKVTVVGAVSEREYTDKNGNQVKAMEVRVTDIALQGGSDNRANGEAKTAPAAKPTAGKPAPHKEPDFGDDDIPF